MMSSKARIAIDGRPLVGNRTGIGVHVAEIAARLESTEPLIFSHTAVENREGIEGLEYIVDRAPRGVVWQQFRFADAARRERCDVVWGPHGTLPWTLKIPSVITIHDLTSLTMPGLHRLRTLFSFNLFIGRSLAIASAIAAVSRVTADAIRRGFGVDSANIEIVPNGVSDFFSPAEGRTPHLPSGLEPGTFILYVGTIEPRKGIDDLFEAWKLQSPRPRLVIAGDPGWKNAALRKRLEPFMATGEVVVTGFVDATALRELYRHCLLFVYPSHYEGFGLPPLEAMACGTAVVASRAGAIPEVAGDGAELFQPRDVVALAAILKRLTSDAVQRGELTARGLQRSSEFSWQRSARLMDELLGRVAER